MRDELNNSQNNDAGSAKNEPAFILVGKMQRAHGVTGEIAMRVDTDFPERIKNGRMLYLGDEHLSVKVIKSRWKGKLLLLLLEGYDNPEEVRELTGSMAFVHVDDIPPLPEGEYYHHQLIGMQVFEGPECLGVLAAILQTGANDVYIIEKDDGKELLIPAIPSVILNVDVENKHMDVKLLEGLR